MDFYNKTEATIISGIAIVLMLIHHFFGFPEYLVNNNEYSYAFAFKDISIPRLLAAFGKIYVGLFAFNSGYVLWKKSSEYNDYKRIMIRGGQFLSSYWIICILFICYAIIANEKAPNFHDLLLNLFGINTDPSAPYVNVAFAWYVSFYLFWLVISPVLLYIFKRTKHTLSDILLLFVFCLAIKLLIKHVPLCYFIYPLGISVSGLLCAKYILFERLSQQIKLNWWSALTIVIVIIFVRQGLLLINLYHIGFEDGLFSFIFIFTLISVFHRYKLSKIKTFMLLLGSYSMNIWYLHGIFFTGDRPLQWILYYPHYWILIILWGIILLLPVAMICKYLQQPLTQMISKFSK